MGRLSYMYQSSSKKIVSSIIISGFQFLRSEVSLHVLAGLEEMTTQPPIVVQTYIHLYYRILQ